MLQWLNRRSVPILKIIRGSQKRHRVSGIPIHGVIHAIWIISNVTGGEDPWVSYLTLGPGRWVWARTCPTSVLSTKEHDTPILEEGLHFCPHPALTPIPLLPDLLHSSLGTEHFPQPCWILEFKEPFPLEPSLQQEVSYPKLGYHKQPSEFLPLPLCHWAVSDRFWKLKEGTEPNILLQILTPIMKIKTFLGLLSKKHEKSLLEIGYTWEVSMGPQRYDMHLIPSSKKKEREIER